MSKTLLIKGGTIVNADQKQKSDILCKNGKIIEIGNDLDSKTCDEILDASNLLVMPGGIDPHTHLELDFMNTVSCDDWYHGTRAALAGGTTTLIDFVIPHRNESLLGALEKQKKRSMRATCDYGFHMAVTQWNSNVEKEMEACVEKHGICSFKMFMAYKGSLMIEDEYLIEVFKTCKRLGALAMVHAEHGDLVSSGQNYIKNELGITGPEGHALSRPSQVEGEATNRAITIARFVNCPLYVVHVSCREAANFISDARRNGQRVFGETVAAYLACDDSSYRNKEFDKASIYCISPPIRSKDHQEFLYNLLVNNDLQLVATDNCSHSIEQKAAGKKDFTKIPNGVHGVEDRMSIVFDKLVASGKITLSRYVELTSTNAAKIFNLYPRKGVIRVGSDADLILMDPKRQRTISAKTHHHNLKYSIYEGMKVYGTVVATILRGNIVWRNNELKVEEGFGEFIARKSFSNVVYDGLDSLDKKLRPVGVVRD